jgi:O-antigen biosynthesis protein
MKVSIVIPAFNNFKFTKKCLESLDATGVSKNAEIIVVDNGSTDDTIKIIPRMGFVKYIRNDKNLGFAKACNQGAAVSNGKIIIFLNNDTEVHPGWLDPIIEDFKHENNLGAVGSKLLFPNGRVEHAGIVFFDSKLPEHIYRLYGTDARGVNKKRYFQAVTAACIATPRDLFIGIGGFDEEDINGLEDIDYCLKLGDKGYKILYDPASVAIHHESVSAGRHFYTPQNYDRFVSLWKDKVKPDAHRFMKADGYGRIMIKITDIINMAYVPEKYGTVPRDIVILRRIYLFPIRIYSFFKRTLKGLRHD